MEKHEFENKQFSDEDITYIKDVLSQFKKVEAFLFYGSLRNNTRHAHIGEISDVNTITTRNGWVVSARRYKDSVEFTTIKGLCTGLPENMEC